MLAIPSQLPPQRGYGGSPPMKPFRLIRSQLSIFASLGAILADLLKCGQGGGR
jgi:hypothetical protein